VAPYARRRRFRSRLRSQQGVCRASAAASTDGRRLDAVHASRCSQTSSPTAPSCRSLRTGQPSAFFRSRSVSNTSRTTIRRCARSWRLLKVDGHLALLYLPHRDLYPRASVSRAPMRTISTTSRRTTFSTRCARSRPTATRWSMRRATACASIRSSRSTRSLRGRGWNESWLRRNRRRPPPWCGRALTATPSGRRRR